MTAYKRLIEQNRKLHYLPGFLLVALIAAIPLFGHLEELPLQRWDESRLALAAFEMLQHKNWFVTTFNWQIDLIAMKPPLQIWLIAASIKIFGANELAVRLPAALAALATCFYLYWFLAAKLQKPLAGIIAPAILVVSAAYVRIHGVRTGDYDGLLTLLTTIFLFNYYLYLDRHNSKNLLYSIIALMLACFTKGVAALMFMPGVFLFTLLSGQLLTVLKEKKFYIGLLIFIIIIPGYYLLREKLAPGSWKGVVENELGGRFLKTLEFHKQPWDFYIRYILDTGFVWTYLAIAGMLTMFSADSKTENLFRSFISVSLVGYLIVISCAGTKLDWYTMPLYPLLCVLAALFIVQCFDWAKNISPKVNAGKTTTLFSLALVLCFYLSYAETLDRVMKPQVNLNDKTFSVSHYLQLINKGKKPVDNLVVLHNEYEQEVIWYDHIDSNIRVESVFKLKKGDEVMFYKEECKNIIEGTYHYVKTDEYYGIYRYRITGRLGDSVITTNQGLQCQVYASNSSMALINSARVIGVPFILL